MDRIQLCRQSPAWIVSLILGCIAFASLGMCGTASASSLVEQGEYISRAADCTSCHSRPKGKPFAGGEALKTPFGDMYGPNITPDPETGIGSWSKEDFVRALRQGVRKDGALIYPAMPYSNYTKISDADLDALWAYLRSLPAVKYSVPKNTLRFPFDVRPGLAVWQNLYFEPGRFQPAADKDASWNRGAYLVEALGHCDACHSPRNIAQATQTQYALTGAQIQGWYAPNISSDPMSNVSKWDVGELATFLKTGRSPGNGKSFGPMQEVIHSSLQYLTDPDLQAMALYLKDGPGSAPPSTTAQAPIPAERLAAGKAVYEQQCSSCHRDDGKGAKASVPALAGNTAITARQPSNVIMSILQGFDPQGSWGAMPSFSKVLSDQQIADVSNYVRNAWGNDGRSGADAKAGVVTVNEWMVASWRGMAEPPPGGEQRAVICPSLPNEVLQPALSQGAEALKQAATDHDKLVAVVAHYTAARPQGSSAQAIEALSTAYCRAVVKQKLPQAQTDTKIAEFAQQVAIVLAHRGS